jgi:outer membrane protein TolC
MKRLVTLFICVCAYATGWAQSAVLTLDECRQKAREHYPEVAQYDLIDKSEKFTLSTAAILWAPQININGQASWQNVVPSFPEQMLQLLQATGIEMKGLNKDQYRVGVDIYQHIWDGGISHAQREEAKAKAAQQRAAIDADLETVEERVDELYFSILLLEKQQFSLQATLALLDTNGMQLEAMLRRGVALQADMDQLRAKLLQTRQSQTNLEAAKTNYRKMLEFFIGQSLENVTLVEPIEPEQKLPTYDNAHYKLFDAQQRLFDAQNKKVNSALQPKIGLFATGFYGYPGYNMFENMLNSDWSWNMMVGVKFSWSLTPFYTLRNNREQISVGRQQVEVQKQIYTFNQDLKAQTESSEIQRLRKLIEQDNEIVLLRQSLRAGQEKKLKHGTVNTTDLLQYITDEQVAVSSRNSHEIELLKALYKTQRL